MGTSPVLAYNGFMAIHYPVSIKFGPGDAVPLMKLVVLSRRCSLWDEPFSTMIKLTGRGEHWCYEAIKYLTNRRLVPRPGY